MVCARRQPSQEQLSPCGYKKTRYCTDVIFLVPWLLFIGFLIYIYYVSISQGGVKVFSGTDYLQYSCGLDNAPSNFEKNIPSGAVWQSSTWSENRFIWYPIWSINTKETLLDPILSTPICVKVCPFFDEETRTYIEKWITRHPNERLDSSEWPEKIQKKLTIFSYGTNVKNSTKLTTVLKSYTALYETTNILNHCIPSIQQVENLKIPSNIPFFNKLFQILATVIEETQLAWKVYLLSFIFGLVLVLVFIILTRFFVKLVVWIVLISSILGLAGLGAFLWIEYKSIPTLGVEYWLRPELFFKTCAIIVWVLAGVSFLVIIVLARKISFACDLLGISARIFAGSVTTFLVPLFIGIISIAFLIFTLFIILCIFSIEKLNFEETLISGKKSGDESNSIITFPGGVEVPLDDILGPFYLKEVGEKTELVLQSFVAQPQGRILMTVIVVFGFFWMITILSSINYMVLSFLVVMWFFSDLNERKKRIPAFACLKAIVWTLFFHLGTIVFLSLFIAILRTIKVICQYIASKLKGIDQTGLVGCVLCCITCLLTCIEKIFIIFSHSIYTVVCITSDSFFSSCCLAIDIITDNLVIIFLLDLITWVVIALMNVFCILGVLLFAKGLFLYTKLSPPLTMEWAVWVFLGVIMYLILCAFTSVIESYAKALLVCYSYDQKMNAPYTYSFTPTLLHATANRLKCLDDAEKHRRYQRSSHYTE